MLLILEYLSTSVYQTLFDVIVVRRLVITGIDVLDKKYVSIEENLITYSEHQVNVQGRPNAVIVQEHILPILEIVHHGQRKKSKIVVLKNELNIPL